MTTRFEGQTLTLSADGPIAKIVLSHAPANEIGLTTLGELEQCVALLTADDTLRVLLIESALPSGFSAGADLRELQRGLADHMAQGGARLDATSEVGKFLDRIHAVMDALDQLPLTVIGALHGVVFGGGFELALACDLRIADQSTRFAFPELRLGLVPGWGGTYRLARETNVALLRDLLLTGRTLGAERAYQVGLVSQVVPRGEHKLAAQKMAEQCARFTRPSIAAAKRLSKPLDRVALQAEKDAFLALFAIEGEGGGPVARALKAFVESTDKRPYLPNTPKENA